MFGYFQYDSCFLDNITNVLYDTNDRIYKGNLFVENKMYESLKMVVSCLLNYSDDPCV